MHEVVEKVFLDNMELQLDAEKTLSSHLTSNSPSYLPILLVG